eukprot:2366837-Rhodomonas_salina.2
MQLISPRVAVPDIDICLHFSVKNNVQRPPALTSAVFADACRIPPAPALQTLVVGGTPRVPPAPPYRTSPPDTLTLSQHTHTRGER